MMILFLTRLFYPHIGGVETHVRELSKRLQKQGHDVFVLTERFSPDLQEKEIVEGVKVYRFNPPKGIAIKIKTWIAMIKYIPLMVKSDVLHCHDVFFWYLPFRFLLPFKKVFTTFHGYETVFPPSKKAIFARKLSEKLSSGNISIGAYIPKWYGTKANDITYGASEKIEQIKNEKDGQSKNIKIVFVGRFEEDVGISTYCKALDALTKKGVGYEAVFLGRGSLENQVKKYGTVHHFNNIYHYSDVLWNADFIFASSYLSMLEGFLCKKLVLSVYENRLKEDYLKMTPFAKWIVAVNSPEKLANKIVLFLQNPNKKKRMIESAYKWVNVQSWDKVTDTYLRLWTL